MGPPVSGKGTQARLLAETLDIPHVSVGQLLHEIARDKKHPLAEEVAKYVNAGKMIPDEDLVNSLIRQRVRQDDCQDGYILDGYPRSIGQAKFLAENLSFNYVYLINVSDEIIIERVVGRRVCPKGHSWHLKYLPTRRAGICDICGGKLFQRKDDTKKIVQDRLKIYHEEMDKIISFYRRQGLLVKINGDQHVEEVFRDTVKVVVDDLLKK